MGACVTSIAFRSFQKQGRYYRQTFDKNNAVQSDEQRVIFYPSKELLRDAMFQQCIIVLFCIGSLQSKISNQGLKFIEVWSIFLPTHGLYLHVQCKSSTNLKKTRIAGIALSVTNKSELLCGVGL